MQLFPINFIDANRFKFPYLLYACSGFGFFVSFALSVALLLSGKESFSVYNIFLKVLGGGLILSIFLFLLMFLISWASYKDETAILKLVQFEDELDFSEVKINILHEDNKWGFIERIIVGQFKGKPFNVRYFFPTRQLTITRLVHFNNLNYNDEQKINRKLNKEGMGICYEGIYRFFKKPKIKKMGKVDLNKEVRSLFQTEKLNEYL